MLAARERKIKGRSPAIQYRPDRPGITEQSHVWYLLKCGSRFIDVLIGVLAGEGYLVLVEKVPNPWDLEKETSPRRNEGCRAGDAIPGVVVADE